MSGFEDFLSAQAVAPGASAAALAPPSEAPAPPDDFAKFLAKAKGEQDALTTQAAQATTAANASSGITAATAGESAQVGKQLGLPQAAVETDPQRFKEQAKAQQNAKLVSENPVLAQWVAANPDAARIAQDEYESLSTVEKLWKGTSNLVYAGAQGLGGSFNQSALAVNRLLAPAANLVGAHDFWTRNMLSPVETAQRETFTQKQDAGIGERAANMAGNLLGMISQISLTAGTGGAPAATTGTVDALATATATAAKSMAFPSLVASVNTSHDVLAQTNDPIAAAKAAIAAYAFATAQGVVPFSAPGGLLTRLGTGALSGAATSEAQRSAMNMILPQSMHQDFNPDELIFNALSGAVLGGVMGPRQDPHIYEGIRQTYTDALKAEQAERDIGKVAALGELAGKSKLRESDPDAFHDFVTQVTDRSSLDAVYVNGSKLAEAFMQSKAELPDSLAKQIAEARVTGGDVRIPIADYATRISGTDVEKAILPEMKAAPDGMTLSEGQAFYQQAAESLKTKAEQIVQDKQASTALEADKEAVAKNVLDQLTAVGRNPDAVNKTYASMVSEFYATMGEREGMKPSELFSELPLRIAGEAAGGESLSQKLGPSSTKDAQTAETVALRKRSSILESIKGCLA